MVFLQNFDRPWLFLLQKRCVGGGRGVCGEETSFPFGITKAVPRPHAALEFFQNLIAVIPTD